MLSFINTAKYVCSIYNPSRRFTPYILEEDFSCWFVTFTESYQDSSTSLEVIICFPFTLLTVMYFISITVIIPPMTQSSLHLAVLSTSAYSGRYEVVIQLLTDHSILFNQGSLFYWSFYCLLYVSTGKVGIEC
ncbi:hypothetical protein EB796_002700 [Bugula neritina]|uniref:Uncharacterized protein n=1 Tax=Bugula neritina TaxID=10212 RepID=A0A7J7KJU7_BUGNE|nr:hypothetical protein EB796_002700 [Bugula neritina]